MAAVQIAGITDAAKKRLTLCLIRIWPTNHTLIRLVKLKAKFKPQIRKRKLQPCRVYKFRRRPWRISLRSCPRPPDYGSSPRQPSAWGTDRRRARVSRDRELGSAPRKFPR